MKPPVPIIDWEAREGKWQEEGVLPPSIFVHCKNCDAKMMAEGPNAAKQQFRHCPSIFRLVETCPADVAVRYATGAAVW